MAFCPTCDTQLVMVRNMFFGECVSTSFRCERCGTTSGEQKDQTPERILGMVQRQIERNLRTGDWKGMLVKPTP